MPAIQVLCEFLRMRKYFILCMFVCHPKNIAAHDYVSQSHKRDMGHVDDAAVQSTVFLEKLQQHHRPIEFSRESIVIIIYFGWFRTICYVRYISKSLELQQRLSLWASARYNLQQFCQQFVANVLIRVLATILCTQHKLMPIPKLGQGNLKSIYLRPYDFEVCNMYWQMKCSFSQKKNVHMIFCFISFLAPMNCRLK